MNSKPHLNGGIATRLNHHFEQVPSLLHRARFLVWALFLGLTALAFVGMGKLRFDMTIEGWFAEDDPGLVSLQAFRAQFGSEDNLYVIYAPLDGDVFSEKSLRLARQIREDLLDRQLALAEDEPSALRRMVRVTALTNAPVLTAEGDALISRHLVRGPVPETKPALEDIRSMADSQETFPRLYYSEDGRYGAIIVETDFGSVETPATDSDSTDATPFMLNLAADTVLMDYQDTAPPAQPEFKSTDLSEYYDFIRAVQVTLTKPEFAEHFRYFPIGNPATTEHDMKMLEEMGSLYSGLLVVMMLVLLLLFRSPSGVVWPVAIVLLSCVWTLGLAGWLGFTLTGFLILTLVMILVIGIADPVHLLSGYLYRRDQGMEHEQAIRTTFGVTANAALLTTVTTVLGMLSVALSPIVPIRVFGLMTAAGIVVAFVLSIYVMPLMLELWWPHKRATGSSLFARLSLRGLLPDPARLSQRLLRPVLPIVERRPWWVIGVFGAATLACLYGSALVRIDTDPIAQYPQHSPIRDSFQVADEEMMGSQSLVVYFDLGREYAFQDPWAMQRFEDLQDQIKSRFSKHVVRTASLVDVAKKSYQTLNEDRPEMHVIPPTPELLSQTLFMFDNSNPTERRRMVSDDYSRAHVTVYLRNAGSYTYTRVFEEMQADIDAAVLALRERYPEAKATVTGMFTLMMNGSDYLAWTSLFTFGTALIAISVVLLLVFGSLRIGLIAILANALPAALCFGVLGLLGIPMDFSTVLIAPIIIGIAVDDTIHFLVHYQREVALDGDVPRALRETLQSVGQAVLFTSLILGLGLSILMFSSSIGTATVGLLGALAVFAALLADLFLLPAMLLVSAPESTRANLLADPA
ncbi:RND family transporter [Aquimonas sp.]|jgi:predicted RND superfamily exporter protein|uniref:efflux RND transporter permease subunit n=1 Tax=Aquimonas sp. TaxID=1872588 RepID=UPI0037BFF283